MLIALAQLTVLLNGKGAVQRATLLGGNAIEYLNFRLNPA